ncbi:alpha/beta hydrolase, partial [Streptomyces sp. NPDC057654]
LYAAVGDTDVPMANATSCAAQLARHGTRAPVLDQGNVDHVGSFKAAEPKVARFFDAVAARGR